MDTRMNDSVIKNAQYRKGLSIAFFNATNATIELLKDDNSKTEEELKEKIIKWRSWFLEEHKNYYATVIEKIGVNYEAKESIEKLNKAKTIEELRTTWVNLSEDERRDPEIIAVTQLIKQQLS